LVLVGQIKEDDQYPSLIREIKKLELEQDVFELGYVPDSDLISLYGAARLSFSPSLYEGFGLPVLESMACGTPVIAGSNSSIPEVVGDTFELFPDNDLDSWVRGVINLLSDERRLELIGKDCIERAKEFSWERTARGTLDAYRKFAKQGSQHRTLHVERCRGQSKQAL
jgi:glycosyltransferase involved in cell wall biosynthesis